MLVPALRAGLARFVEQLLTGELPRNKDYGLTRFISQLYSNFEEQTPEIVAYMAELVQAATNGEQSVVLADRKYFASTYASGMTMALVPTGEAAASPNAKLFEFGGASNGNCFVERASNESIVEAELQAAASEKRRHREFLARGLLERLHQDLHHRTRRRVCVWMTPHNRGRLTAAQRADVADVLGLTESNFDEGAEKALAAASLPKLCEVLVILGKDNARS